MNYRIKLVVRTAAALLFVSALARTADGFQAQQNGGGISAARVERERQMRDMLEREEREQETQLMMALTEQYHRRPERRPPTLPFAQIRADYVRIQEVNNALAQAVATGNTLDLKLVAQSTGEIKKRAERLKENLALPESEANDARAKAAMVGTEPAQLKSALTTLDGLILRCVRNPLFKSPGLVDLRQSPQVRRELEAIIELSGQVKKRSEQLHKAAQQQSQPSQ